MKIIARLKDDQYPWQGTDHIRDIARAVLINDEGQVLLEHVLDDDEFGHRDYYETPGGGVRPGERFEDALVREIEEEVGYKAEIILELGDVIDYYNLIRRENHNHYYLARVTGKGVMRQDPGEIKRIDKIIWVSIDEAIRLYEDMQDVLLGKLVKRRELPVLKLARKALQRKAR